MSKLLQFLYNFNKYNTKLVFFFKYSRLIKKVLDIFWDLGLIFGYKVVLNKFNDYFIIYLKKGKNINIGVVKRVEVLIRSSFKNNNISLNDLSRLLVKENGLSTYLIITRIGILDAKSAIKQKISGELLCKIYF